MLQAGNSRVQFPVRSLDFSVYLIFPAAIFSLGSTQLPTEMSTRDLPGCEGQPARKADSFTAICELIVWKMWGLQRFTTLWASAASYRNIIHYLLHL
jgi:hypothetical protein